jgi:hypothetical protein
LTLSDFLYFFHQSQQRNATATNATQKPKESNQIASPASFILRACVCFFIINSACRWLPHTASLSPLLPMCVPPSFRPKQCHLHHHKSKQGKKRRVVFALGKPATTHGARATANTTTTTTSQRPPPVHHHPLINCFRSASPGSLDASDQCPTCVHWPCRACTPSSTSSPPLRLLHFLPPTPTPPPYASITAALRRGQGTGTGRDGVPRTKWLSPFPMLSSASRHALPLFPSIHSPCVHPPDRSRHA